MTTIADGMIRNFYYGIYGAGSVVARHNLGDGDLRYGTVNMLITYLAFPAKLMTQISEVFLAINRLLVIKRVAVDGNFVPGVVDRVFSRVNCLAYAAIIFPFCVANGYGYWVDKLFGAKLPCCGCG